MKNGCLGRIIRGTAISTFLVGGISIAAEGYMLHKYMGVNNLNDAGSIGNVIIEQLPTAWPMIKTMPGDFVESFKRQEETSSRRVNLEHSGSIPVYILKGASVNVYLSKNHSNLETVGENQRGLDQNQKVVVLKDPTFKYDPREKQYSKNVLILPILSNNIYGLIEVPYSSNSKDNNTHFNISVDARYTTQPNELNYDGTCVNSTCDFAL